MILDLIALDNSSKVWIYQSSREFTYDELDIIREQLFPFLDQWTSHSKSLRTYGNVFHRRFLALFVDETRSSGASGCSIDNSVRFIKDLGNQLEVDFFDRMTYCYFDKEEYIQEVPHNSIKEAYKKQDFNEDTIFFDHLVKTKGEFLKSWTKPLKESWHFKFVN